MDSFSKPDRFKYDTNCNADSNNYIQCHVITKFDVLKAVNMLLMAQIYYLYMYHYYLL